jgi:hypothetical protein
VASLSVGGDVPAYGRAWNQTRGNGPRRLVVWRVRAGVDTRRRCCTCGTCGARPSHR